MRLVRRRIRTTRIPIKARTLLLKITKTNKPTTENSKMTVVSGETIHNVLKSTLYITAAEVTTTSHVVTVDDIPISLPTIAMAHHLPTPT